MALEVARAHSDPSCPTTQVAVQLVAPRASQALQAHAKTILDAAIREVTADLVRILFALFVQWWGNYDSAVSRCPSHLALPIARCRYGPGESGPQQDEAWAHAACVQSTVRSSVGQTSSEK